MALLRPQWEELEEKRQTERERARIPDLRQVAQAEVPMGALTRSHEWNLYLQVIQAMIGAAEKEAEAALAMLEDPEELDGTEMARRKMKLLLRRQAVQTMTELRDIPRMLLEGGREAKKLLRKHGVRD
jgi:hypothetical protein